LRVSILASGSSGNITLLETERTRLLVDAGLGKRETLARLAAAGRTVEQLDGILITHEHTDHCNGLPQMLGLWKAPLYVTEPTMDAMQRMLPVTFGKRLKRVETIQPGQHFAVGDIDVHAFAIPHDAADPIGFTFRSNGAKMAMVTDLGYMPELVKVHLRAADCLVLESNHDLDMLKVGPYPWVVKQRVLSRTGHLSNHAVSEYLSDREFEVLKLLAAGKSVSDIGEQISLSASTVSTYRARILTKMNLKTNADLTLYSVEHKLI